jgi:hypothetical protein
VDDLVDDERIFCGYRASLFDAAAPQHIGRVHVVNCPRERAAEQHEVPLDEGIDEALVRGRVSLLAFGVRSASQDYQNVRHWRSSEL